MKQILIILCLASSLQAQEQTAPPTDKAAQEKPAQKPIKRFQNTPVPNQGKTNICAGVASVFAIEQSLGVKFESLEEVLDLGQMIDPSYNRNGRTAINPVTPLSAYGLVRDTSGFLAYPINEGFAKIEAAVTRGDIAIIHIKPADAVAHAVCVTDYRKDQNSEEQYKVHDSSGGRVFWIQKATFIRQAEARVPGKVYTSIIDCSQRVTGHVPQALPSEVALLDSIHSANFCQQLDRALAEYKAQSKDGNELISTSLTLLQSCNTDIMNIAFYWDGRINQHSIRGLSRVLRANLLAERKVCATINLSDGNEKSVVRFGTLIGADPKGFFFKVGDVTIHILERDLVQKLSYSVMGFRGRETELTPQRNLILAYPRDDKGKAVMGTKKASGLRKDGQTNHEK